MLLYVFLHCTFSLIRVSSFILLPSPNLNTFFCIWKLTNIQINGQQKSHIFPFLLILVLESCYYYSFFRVHFLSVLSFALYLPPDNPNFPLFPITSFLLSFPFSCSPSHPYSFSWVILTIISFLSSFLFPLTEVYALLFQHPFLFFPSFFASWFLLSYYPFLSFLLSLSSDSYLCSSFQSSPPFVPPFSVFRFLIMSFFSIKSSYFSSFLKISSFLFSFLCSLILFCPSFQYPCFLLLFYLPPNS